jgi:serine/threonine protein phosphatase PrpC
MIPNSHSNLVIGHQTHAGETGKNNEDRALIRAYQGQPGEAGGITLAVIADGIGGHRAGEVASQIAVNTFTEIFDQAEPRAYLDLFTTAFSTAQQTITRHIAANPESEGMGTTCSAVIIANQRLYMAYVGDSRIFLIRNGTLRQISIDHTWVQEAIDHGILTKVEARKHPNRHVVRRHLGAGHDPTPDLRLRLSDTEKPEDSRQNQGLPLNPGDIVLLSSDGMTDLVEDHEILAAFESQTPQQAVDALVLMARQRGGYDNITVTALMVPSLPETVVAPSKGRRSAITASTIIGISLIAIIALAVFATLAVSVSFLVLNQLGSADTATPTATRIVNTAIPLPTLSSTPQEAILISPTPIPPGSSTPTRVSTDEPAVTPTTDLTEVWVTLTAQAAQLATPTP